MLPNALPRLPRQGSAPRLGSAPPLGSASSMGHADTWRTLDASPQRRPNSSPLVPFEHLECSAERSEIVRFAALRDTLASPQPAGSVLAFTLQTKDGAGSIIRAGGARWSVIVRGLTVDHTVDGGVKDLGTGQYDVSTQVRRDAIVVPAAAPPAPSALAGPGIELATPVECDQRLASTGTTPTTTTTHTTGTTPHSGAIWTLVGPFRWYLAASKFAEQLQPPLPRCTVTHRDTWYLLCCASHRLSASNCPHAPYYVFESYRFGHRVRTPCPSLASGERQ